MIGFPPTDSLVLVTFHLCDRLRLGATIRADLPAEKHGPDLVQQLCPTVVDQDVDVVVPVVVGGGTADPPDLPYRWLIELVGQGLADVGIGVTHPVWVPAVERDATWWCYENIECTGQVPDPRSSAVTALFALSGLVTYGSRAEMGAHLAPDPEDRTAHRAHLLAERAADRAEADPVEQWGVMRAAIDSAAERPELPELDDEQIVRLLETLYDPLVRDNCLTVLLTEDADAAERLWTVLTRASPVPERAEPACLLAMSAYLRGEGVLTNLALDVVLDAEPDHVMAELLRDLVDTGTPPQWFRAMLAESVAMAEIIHTDEEAAE
jgi:hypothetical protein